MTPPVFTPITRRGWPHNLEADYRQAPTIFALLLIAIIVDIISGRGGGAAAAADGTNSEKSHQA